MNDNEMMRAAIEQACSDSKVLHDIWCSESAKVEYFNRPHLVEAQRVVHRIAGGSLTFGFESVASIARVCEHVLRETIVQQYNPSEFLSEKHQHKISTLIQNLYDSCLQARSQFFEESVVSMNDSDHFSGSASSNGLHILVADDDPVMRMFVQKKLEKRGFKITVAEDGEEAYSLIQTVEPDLVLLDGLMPKMSGFDVLNKMRDNAKVSHIPVFMLTALADQENVADGILSGADDYIIKPFDVDEVVDKIKRACV